MAIEYAKPATLRVPSAGGRFWAIFSTVVLLIALFGLLVWPTRYKFEQINGNLIRIDRISGQVDAFRNTMWTPWYPDPTGYPAK